MGGLLTETTVGIRVFRCPRCLLAQLGPLYTSGGLGISQKLARSLNADYSWRPGWNQAQCLPGCGPTAGWPHPAPAPRCTCGLYVLHPDCDLAVAAWMPQAYKGMFAAVVEIRGDCEIHDEGARAARARIVATEVCVCGFRPPEVPVINSARIAWREFGSAVPRSVRPGTAPYVTPSIVPAAAWHRPYVGQPIASTSSSTLQFFPSSTLQFFPPVPPPPAPRRRTWRSRLSSLFAGWG